MMEAKITMKDTYITEIIRINSFYYDVLGGIEYLVLDTTNDGIKRYKSDDVDTFSLTGIHHS